MSKNSLKSATTTNNNTNGNGVNREVQENKRNNNNSHMAMATANRAIVDWLGTLPLSKQVHNSLGRDLSDAVLVAEIVAHFLPRYIIISTFTHVHSFALKKYNWETLDRVVLRHLGIRLRQENIDGLAHGEETTMQSFLILLRQRINEAIEQRRFRPSSNNQSRPNSRGGSQLQLDQLDVLDQCQLSGTLPAKDADSNNKPETLTESAAGPSKSADVPPTYNCKSEWQVERINNDQLIERLYMKLRAQELELAKKVEQCEMWKRKVDKLVELICEKNTQVNNVEQLLDECNDSNFDN